jgi:pullulanase/glycogen debranching enzyme
VNYLESHDGYTLGDFIRLTLNPALAASKPTRESLVPLSDIEKRIARLAALYLFVSQGVLMIHEGQEWSRTKSLDHNSYEKDDITNHLVFSDADENADLVAYFKGLIRLRSDTQVFRRATADQIHFHRYDDSLHLTATFDTPDGSWLVSLNANPTQSQIVHLPPGYWKVLVSEAHAGVQPIATIGGIVQLAPISGMVLRK